MKEERTNAAGWVLTPKHFPFPTGNAKKRRQTVDDGKWQEKPSSGLAEKWSARTAPELGQLLNFPGLAEEAGCCMSCELQANSER